MNDGPPNESAGRPPILWADGRALITLRLRLVRNILATVREHSRLKIAVVTVFGFGVLMGLSFLFYRMFEFLNERTFRDMRVILDEYVFALFFLTLFVMLVFSTAIIAFSSLFRAAETEFLLSQPVSVGAVFLHKFSEATTFSSWAFLVLGVPLFVAYGVANDVPWYFFPGIVLFFVAFIPLPACIGAAIAILVAAYFPRKRSHVLAGAGLLVAAVVGSWAIHMARFLRHSFEMSQAWIQKILATISFCQNPWLPSRWVGKGVAAIAHGQPAEALFFFLLLLSNSLFCGMLCYLLAVRVLRRGWSVCQASAVQRKYRLDGPLDRALEAATFFLRPEMRLFVKKDVKTFVRDPAQWSQVLIFVGLLGVYSLNLRNLGHDTMDLAWKNIISFLNLAATSLTLSTYTGRFVFPMISMEGRRFWVLGLLPVERRSILLGKFFFSVSGALLISESLMLLSDYMLRMPVGMTALHCGVVGLLCVGLSAIAVGLGATFPNLREDDPSKIVAGFGGTLNLMLSLVFVTVVVGMVAAPCHLYFARGIISIETFRTWMAASIGAAVVLSVVTCLIPIRVGIRAFERMEF
jgi:ABC-2 type transport system permease protein